MARLDWSSPSTSVPAVVDGTVLTIDSAAGSFASSSGATAAPDATSSLGAALARSSDGSARPGSGVPTATAPPSPPSARSYAEARPSTSVGSTSPEAARYTTTSP